MNQHTAMAVIYSVFWISLAFMFHSCFAHASNVVPKLDVDKCYVLWVKKEYEDKFNRSIGMTRKQKSDNRLLIPVFDNPSFGIAKIESGNYVTYGSGIRLEKTYSEFKTKVGEMIEIDKYNEEMLTKLFMSSFLKFPLKKLENIVQSDGYQKVDCKELETSLYL